VCGETLVSTRLRAVADIDIGPGIGSRGRRPRNRLNKRLPGGGGGEGFEPPGDIYGRQRFSRPRQFSTPTVIAASTPRAMRCRWRAPVHEVPQGSWTNLAGARSDSVDYGDTFLEVHQGSTSLSSQVTHQSSSVQRIRRDA
jgi:hypothetical protein